MSHKLRAVLKTYFETGDRPTQSQFADLIDSLGLFNVLTRNALQILKADSQLETESFFKITDACTDTKKVIIFPVASNEIAGIALDLTSNGVSAFGTYNLDDDTFTPLSGSGFDYESITGWNAYYPGLRLGPYGDGTNKLRWYQDF